MADHWAMGGEGAADVARAVVKVADSGKSKLKLLYPDEMPLLEKIRTISRKSIAPKISTCINRCAISSRRSRPWVMANCRSALPRRSTASPPMGTSRRAGDHVVPVREVRLSAGAEFVVAICGEIMTMPGLPSVPAADLIDVGPDGKIVGLF